MGNAVSLLLESCPDLFPVSFYRVCLAFLARGARWSKTVKIFRVYYADSMGEPGLPTGACGPVHTAWAFFASLCSALPCSALSVWAGMGGCLGLGGCQNT